MDLVATPSQTVGPYFHLGLTGTRAVPCIADPNAKGERVTVACTVLDGEGKPINDAMLEIWQADANGKYNHPEDQQQKQSDPACRGFGRVGTDENGFCSFETVKPGRVPYVDGRLQAPHLNISVFARGVLTRLATRLYFASDPANAEDPVLALVPVARRDTLMARPDHGRAGTWRFEIRLCGERETVFFDV